MTTPLPLSAEARTLAILALAAAAVVGLLLALRWYLRRRRRLARMRAVTRCGLDHLRGVLIPDGQGGMLHLDFLLLTTRGVVVIDLRDVAGNIFGGDQMDRWTVMNGAHRSTFLNPQAALYDRIAAVRAVAQDLPVEGRIVFTARGQFPKGLPSHTLMLESLEAEFPVLDAAGNRSLLERWMPAWASLKQSVTPSRLVTPRRPVV